MKKQNHLFFFDVETTGLPLARGKNYHDVSNWPRIVSICWLITDDQGKISQMYYEFIKPDGFVIPKDAEGIHGISTEEATAKGVELNQAFSALEDSFKRYSINYIIAHNIEFDRNVLFSEFVRKDHSALHAMNRIPTLCTMKSSTAYCKIPHKCGSWKGGYKWPKLDELHRHLFGYEFMNQHDASQDILATKDCFFELQKRGIL